MSKFLVRCVTNYTKGHQNSVVWESNPLLLAYETNVIFRFTHPPAGMTRLELTTSRAQSERSSQTELHPKMKWFCPSSSLCQHFYRGHFSRPGSRLLSALRTQFFFLRDSLIRFVDNLYKSLTISYLIHILYQKFFNFSTRVSIKYSFNYSLF